MEKIRIIDGDAPIGEQVRIEIEIPKRLYELADPVVETWYMNWNEFVSEAIRNQLKLLEALEEVKANE